MSDAGDATNGARPGNMEIFTFGDPEPVLDRRMLLDHLQCLNAGRWYEPPLSLDGLSRTYHASPHHSSAIQLKRNLLVAAFEPSRMLSRRDFKAAVQDYLILGNCYLEQRYNIAGGPMRLEHALAKYVRRGVEAGRYYFVPGTMQETEFRRDAICHLLQPDLNQEIYGLPEYVSALQSALLNEASTLFRRRYFLNGSHAGYILYATGDFAEGDMDAMRDALRKSKGPGNFRNLLVHAPQGKIDGIKLLPIAEVGAKDDFLGIKNITRDDVLAAHRVPPQLLGIVPTNAGGFGSITDAVGAFWQLEIMPLQAEFDAINEWVGMEVVRWREWVPPASSAPAAGAGAGRRP